MMNQKTDLPHFSGNGFSAQGVARLKVQSPQEHNNGRKLRPVLRLAEEHCANWCHGNCCQGIDFRKNGNLYQWRAFGSPCLLCKGSRCKYLEESVLPMERRKENDWKPFHIGEIFREAARIYHQEFPETTPSEVFERMCPDCGKHRIGPRHRYCGGCRKRRRRMTNAANQRNWQKKRVHPNTVNGNGSSLGAASRGTSLDTRYGDTAESVLPPKLYHAQEVSR